MVEIAPEHRAIGPLHQHRGQQTHQITYAAYTVCTVAHQQSIHDRCNCLYISSPTVCTIAHQRPTHQRCTFLYSSTLSVYTLVCECTRSLAVCTRAPALWVRCIHKRCHLWGCDRPRQQNDVNTHLRGLRATITLKQA
jgi:hypothetical protein